MKRPEETRATEVLAELNITHLPIPVEAIARSCGASVAYLAYEGDLSGMLFRKDGRVIIAVNSAHPTVRQRYTIAHELGHLLMHKGRDVWVDGAVRVNFRNAESAWATKKEEIQANAFAAALLMPESCVLDEAVQRIRLGQAKTADELALLLARRFEVSRSAMQYRLINLGLIDPDHS